MDDFSELPDDIAQNRRHVDQLQDGLAYRIGALVEGLAANTDVVARLVKTIGRLEVLHGGLQMDVGHLTDDLKHLSDGLTKANIDIMGISSKLSALGIDEETKKDLQYLRAQRETADDRRFVVRAVQVTIACAVVLAVGSWVWLGVRHQAASDISQTYRGAPYEKYKE